ncbi:hypothetical protein [Xanthobacter sediminis]
MTRAEYRRASLHPQARLGACPRTAEDHTGRVHADLMRHAADARSLVAICGAVEAPYSLSDHRTYLARAKRVRLTGSWR